MTFITTILRPSTGIRQTLLFTDTNSLAYEINTKDFYKDINPDNEKRFDNSDYLTNRPFGIKGGLNSKVLGVLKEEAGGKQIVEFVGWRVNFTLTKCLMDLLMKNVRAKNDTKRSIQFDDYRECLFCRKEQHRKINVIRSHCHQIYTEELNKIALSSDDDK